MTFDYRSLIIHLGDETKEALRLGDAIPLMPALALYAILRSGMRFFDYALPGSCVNTAINLSFAVGHCIAATNWLDTRLSTQTSAHAWAWFMCGIFALGIMLWKRPLPVMTERGKLESFNGWMGLIMSGLAISIHESLWFATYFILHPDPMEVQTNLLIYGSFWATALIVAIPLFWVLDLKRYLNKWIMIIGLGFMAGFYTGWALIGYPLTLDLKTGDAPPALFGITWVDSIEFYSWLFMFAIVGLAYVAEKTRPPH